MQKEMPEKCKMTENLGHHPLNHNPANKSDEYSKASVTGVWFKDGLRFECRRCGDCCKASGIVYVRSDEIERIRRYLGVEEDLFKKSFLRDIGGLTSLGERDDGACVMLDSDTDRCHIYEVRPMQCSTFPFWPEFLERPYLWGRQSYLCPGMNCGHHWGLEEIKQKMLK